MSRHAGSFIACCCLICGTLTVCAQEAAPAPTVTIARPLSREVVDHVEFPGQTVAANEVNLRSSLATTITRVLAEPGAMVKAGEVLFQLDERKFQAAFDQAQAELQLAEAKLKLATNSHARLVKLVQAKAATTDELQLAELERLQAEATVQQARAALQVPLLDLQATRVLAPFDGRLGQRLASVGSVVTPDTNLGTLVSSGRLQVVFGFDERTFLKCAAQNPKSDVVEIGLAAGTTFPLTGRVVAVGNQFDPVTGKLPVRAELTETPRDLLPGLPVRMRLRIGAPYSALLVPAAAVVSVDKNHFVRVVDRNQIVQLKRVVPGERFGELQNLREGVAATDWIVIAAPAELPVGTKVQVKSTELPPP